jgi:hypothetical protein
MNNEDKMRLEYPADFIKSGVRGKYVSHYREGTNFVLVDIDLYKLFSRFRISLNRALHKFAEEQHVMYLKAVPRHSDRAILKQVDEWRIGWLIDLPGVNAQKN